MIEEGLIEGNPTRTKLTSEKIQECGAMPEMIKAMEHDPVEVRIAPVEACKTIESGAFSWLQN